jgi:hypothetical protein
MESDRLGKGGREGWERLKSLLEKVSRGSEIKFAMVDLATERAWLADRNGWLVVCPHRLALAKKQGGLSISVANGNGKRMAIL